jgi:hypothetical protein
MKRAAIRGLVLDDTEWPIAGAAVSLSPLSPGLTVQDIGQYSDNEGRYLWTDLDEGRYEVTIRVDGFHVASAQTYAGAGVPARADFHLTRLPRRRVPESLPAERYGNPSEQVSSDLTGTDMVDGSD